MQDSHDLSLTANHEDALVLTHYDEYVRSRSQTALQAAGEHAYRAVSVLMEADGVTVFGAYELISAWLPGVNALLHGVADRLGSNTAARLCAVWQLMGLEGPAPGWIVDETELTCRLLTAALISEDFEIPDVRERVERLPHRRVACLLVRELERSEAPWKAALSDRDYRRLAHSYASRTGSGRGLLSSALERVDEKDSVVAKLTHWLDDGAQPEVLASWLDAALTAHVPAVLA